MFTPFVEDRDILGGQKEIITAPLWSDAQASLFRIFTSSYQSSNQQRYYYELYNSASTNVNSEPQFSVAYGDTKGSGSDRGTGNIDDLPTKSIYGQYRQLLLDAGTNLFTFSNGETSEYVYVININRARFKDKVATDNWQLSIGKLNSTTTSASISTGNDIFTLIDDSGASTIEYTQQGGRVFNIRSGSITNGIQTTDSTPWGLFYPDNGIIVLNGKALDASGSFGTKRTPSTGSVNQQNAFRLFTSISGAMSFNTASFSFQARTSEVVSSLYYYVRLYNGEYNYSTNPTFLTGSTSAVKYQSMIIDPTVYMTSIGLYDDNQVLLAVAKVSIPIQKTFEKEVVVKVKIDW